MIRTSCDHFVSKNATADGGRRCQSEYASGSRVRTNDRELDGHEDADEVEERLERWPPLGAHELPGAWGEDEGIPSGDSHSADHEVLVRAEVRGQIQGRG